MYATYEDAEGSVHKTRKALQSHMEFDAEQGNETDYKWVLRRSSSPHVVAAAVMCAALAGHVLSECQHQLPMLGIMLQVLCELLNSLSSGVLIWDECAKAGNAGAHRTTSSIMYCAAAQ